MTNPLWVVKTRMCTTAKTDPGAYRGLTDGLLRIKNTEGFKGYYRGFIPALFGVSHGALQFMAYEELKKWRSRSGQKPENLDTTEYILFAASSKIFAATATYPYQVLKSRLQVSRSIHTGVLDCIGRTYRGEGLVGFYKGLVPNVVRVLPGTCVTFAVYETAVGYFRRHPRYND